MFAHISQVGVKLKYVEAVMLSNLAHTSKSQSLEPALHNRIRQLVGV